MNYQELINMIRYNIVLVSAATICICWLWEMANDYAKDALGVTNPF